ncbi:Asp-tRNA(Asn)/Glu-tRNA(Gln) amidotransferase subunit GatC [Candidatus Nitrosacidococcus sp. I8]|uniref:Asp-tRNA(Asn)/Glu-tRNA(Gln) amidotransferase subunit GatC n=1 Tax=Candidatus Nitrosacidococcus sp. I8 TaxID=2942908 RepID=UPI002226DD0E|nr:Asp-tRNA(Asn)/Glu-tRNA(Gln) amidotransferase subunit GatC [Candidatus Nitrosacidococcus sp. I8]CAH9019428.1 Glutamyl-tRNA(Gln) amidotransferase subunit C [Candidatus Nitrosacidococcus sp. I8]
MTLKPSDVERIAYLARLDINTKDIPAYTENLSHILEFVAQMDQVDVSGITPISHPLGAHQRLRSDEVTETDKREVFQINAPSVEAGVYLVPKVIE